MSAVFFTQVKEITHSTLRLKKQNKNSHIDYFLIPQNQLYAVRNSFIGSMTWSDHSPVILSYALIDAFTSKSRTLRLNESLLQDQQVLTDITKELGLNFQTNDTSDCDSGKLTKRLNAECSLNTVLCLKNNALNN